MEANCLSDLQWFFDVANCCGGSEPGRLPPAPCAKSNISGGLPNQHSQMSLVDLKSSYSPRPCRTCPQKKRAFDKVLPQSPDKAIDLDEDEEVSKQAEPRKAKSVIEVLADSFEETQVDADNRMEVTPSRYGYEFWSQPLNLEDDGVVCVEDEDIIGTVVLVED